MNFDLDAQTRVALGMELAKFLNSFFTTLPDRPVQPPLENRKFDALTNALPEQGTDPILLFKEVSKQLVEEGFHVPSGNYFGLMNPTPAYMAVIAEGMVAGLNPQLATQARQQLASKIENETLRWLVERTGWKDDAGTTVGTGTFTSGGNEANFSGLAMALAYVCPESVEDGVRAIEGQPVLYASEEAHHSLDKSVGLMGLGRKALCKIPVDPNMHIDARKLELQIRADLRAAKKPFCIVGTLGTTNSGAIDDIVTLAVIAKKYNLWLHVDGAYGAGAMLSDKHHEIMRGVEMADSLTVDPHKWMAMPYAAGVILTRHAEMLEKTFGVHTPYMPKVDGATLVDNYLVSTQWSRRCNALKLWLTLRAHGRVGYEKHITHQLDIARAFAEKIRHSKSFELACEPDLTILNLRVKSIDMDEAEYAIIHKTIVDEVTKSGERWISATQICGMSVIRVMVISYLTEWRHLEALWKSMEHAASKLKK
jgi:aromatic-L-amino-acid decarboxylase